MPAEELTPWWRALKKGGLLNPNVPAGMEYQASLLRADGVRVSPLRKQLAVFDFVDRLPKDDLEKRRP